MSNSAEHWEGVYAGAGAHSWDQDQPTVALELLASASVRPDAAVVDVGGGGDGALAAALLARGPQRAAAVVYPRVESVRHVSGDHDGAGAQLGVPPMRWPMR
jgi:hypothetical protein